MKKRYLLLLLLIPFFVFAEPNYELQTSETTIEIGKTVTAKVILKNVSEWDIKLEGTGSSTCSWKEKDSTDNKVNTDKSFEIKCDGTKEGTMVLKINGSISDADGYKKEVSMSKTVTVYKVKSSNNLLNVLKVDGLVISNFSSDKFEYNIPDTLNKSIRIEATTQDSFAKVSGVGNVDLKYGKNSIKVEVTAENGETKNYIINVVRTDDRDSNNYLKSLTIDKQSIKFNREITAYTIKLDHNIDEIVITAEPESEKSTINGLGTKKIKDYLNEFTVLVTSENGESKTYFIRVIRKDKDGNYGKLSDNNTVTNIYVENEEIKFNKDIKKYNVLLEDKNTVDINVVTEENTSTVEIKNNTNLKDGLNKVDIIVTSESGKTNEYVINVYKFTDSTKSVVEKDKKNKDTKDKSSSSGKVGIFWLFMALIELGILGFIVYRKFDFKQLINNPNETKEERESLKKMIDEKVAVLRSKYEVKKDVVETKTEETKEEVKDKIEEVKEDIKEKVEDVKEKVEEAKEKIESKEPENKDKKDPMEDISKSINDEINKTIEGDIKETKE